MTIPGEGPAAADLADAPRRPSWLYWVLALVIGVGASLAGYVAAARSDAARRHEDLERHVGDRARLLELRLRHAAAALATLAGVARTPAADDLRAFQRWMRDLEAGVDPWVSCAWVPRIAAADRVAFENAADAAGLDGVRVRVRDHGPRAARREHAPVAIGVPAPRVGAWAGWDLLSDPVAAAALAAAAKDPRGEGAPPAIATDLTLPPPAADRAAILLVRCVRAPDGESVRPPAGDGDVRGWAVAWIDAALFLGEGIDLLDAVGIDLYLFESASEPRPLVSRGTRLRPPERLPAWADVDPAALRAEHPVPVGDRTWVLRGVPTAFHPAGVAPWHAWFALIGGLLVTGLAAAALRAAARRESDVRHAVTERTLELVRTNEVLRREIAVRRVAEASLARATDRLDVVLSSLTDGVVATDAEGRVSFVNPVAEVLTGVPRDEARGQPIGDVLRLVTEGRREPVALPTLAALTSEGAARPEAVAVAVARGGTERPVGWRALPMNDHAGRTFGALVLLHDLSDVRHREEAAREHEALFDALSRQIPESLMLIDADDPDGAWRILYANDVAALSRGWEPGELVGRTIADVAAPETVNLAAERIARLRDGGTLVFEAMHRRRDGSLFPVEVTARGMRWRGRRVILAVQRDITERRRAEEERRRLEVQAEHARRLESLRGLAGDVAHDFNNALTGILGNAELALLDLPDASPVRGRVEEVVRAGRRAAELTQQMLAWAGRSTVVLRPVRLDDLVREAAARVQVSVGPQRKLRLDLPGDVPAVEGDPHRLGRLLEDLIAHAAGATGDRPGTVAVRVAVEEVDARWLAGAYGASGLPSGRYVVVEVSDEGRLADEEAQRRLFEPSFRPKEGGPSADLSALPGILKAHRGAIRLRGDARGTTYRVVLPPTA